MSAQFHLFEVCWEVCNRVGGIHTAVSTKARTQVERFGDRYVAIGPWFPADGGGREKDVFDPEGGTEAFEEACRADGLPVRVGRWRIPGRPRTILVDFGALSSRKDALLARLWKAHRVDSLFGGRDYVDAVLFGHAAAMALERWWEQAAVSHPGGAVAQFHEWRAGSGLLHVRESMPDVGTCLTIHATVHGRSLGGPLEPAGGAGLPSVPPEERRADPIRVHSEHSLEEATARAADVLAAASPTAADECARFLGRPADFVLPTGIDVEALDPLAAPDARSAARARLREFVGRFLDRDASDAFLLSVTGRYDFHDKGIDLLLDAMAVLDRRPDPRRPGRPLVLLALLPVPCGGVRADVRARLDGAANGDAASGGGMPAPIATHDLFDPDRDPIRARCAGLRLGNAPGRRVAVIHVPAQVSAGDGVVGLDHEAALSGTDLTVYPSLYEPWGYGPLESLAVGVPTVTTDCAGFGRWARAAGLGAVNGVHVVSRRRVPHAEACLDLVEVVESVLESPRGPDAVARACRDAARRASWTDAMPKHEEAFRAALRAARARIGLERAAGISAPTAAPEPGRAPAANGNGAKNGGNGKAAPPALPPALSGLARLAGNLWWSWDPEAATLFEDLSRRVWRAGRHSPLRSLRSLPAEDLAALAADPGWRARVDRVLARFDAYMAAGAKGAAADRDRRRPVAYFCAEFGVHETLPTYSGGLGVLAGDLLKSASDLGLPLVGVGLLYRKGRLRQRLGPTGEQMLSVVESDPTDLAVEAVRDAKGLPIEVHVDVEDRRIAVRAWRAHVGRVDLYLLDTDAEGNEPDDRIVTHLLYPSDPEARLRKEIVLGRGGIRMLTALGIEPSFVHLNEGHPAFAAVERACALVRGGAAFPAAREEVRRTTAFTTHTPVPAGHDRFDASLVRRCLADVPAALGVSWETFLALGAEAAGGASFNMTRLAVALASKVNGVSKLHAAVSRRLLREAWPGTPSEDDVPVAAVTNGVHLPTWTQAEVARALGVEGRSPRGEDFVRGAARLDPARLWRARQGARRRLLAQVRRRLERRFVERLLAPGELDAALGALTDRAMLVGFARRFAAYKRADLLLRDEGRLATLLSREDRPVRVFFAGKAHPDDRAGRAILKRVARAAREGPLAGRVFFLEDYGIGLARALVQGCDLWVNVPLRGQEASGTSGMKVAANGGLNVSVPDGWWPEAADGTNGWTVAPDAPAGSPAEEGDADALYGLLESEVVPLFFERDEDGVPRRWLERVARSLATIPPVFDSDRMVKEYWNWAYAARP